MRIATVTEVATEAATKATSGKVEWLELSLRAGMMVETEALRK